MDDALQERLINWGYAVCDVALRKWVDPDAPAPGAFPFPLPASASSMAAPRQSTPLPVFRELSRVRRRPRHDGALRDGRA